MHRGRGRVVRLTLCRKPWSCRTIVVALATLLGPAADASGVHAVVVQPLPTATPLPTCDEPPGRVSRLWNLPSSMTVREISERYAPVFWFAPFESRPERLPWDEADTDAAPTVYYWVTRVLPRDGENAFNVDLARPEESTIDVACAKEIHIHYFLYFGNEIGLNAHPHDLEGLLVQLKLDPREEETPEPHRVEELYVKGAAHGLNWTANRLRLARPDDDPEARGREHVTSFPLTMLVDKGKHSTCPDRDGNGQYLPGYDVNRYVNDSWGVRDSFGAGYVEAKYQAYMSEARTHESRIFPPLDVSSSLKEELMDTCSYFGPPSWSGTPYELRATTRACEPVAEGDAPCREESADWIDRQRSGKGTAIEHKRLATMFSGEEMDQHQFTLLPPDQGGPGHFWREEFLSGFSKRWDGTSSLAWLAAGKWTPLNLWLVPRLTVSMDGTGFGGTPLQSVGLVISPSGARFMDWYGVASWERTVANRRGRRDNAAGAELGLRVRIAAKEVPLLRNVARRIPWVKGSLLGLRVGIHSNVALSRDGDGRPPVSRGTFRDHRLVFELGGGAW